VHFNQPTLLHDGHGDLCDTLLPRLRALVEQTMAAARKRASCQQQEASRALVQATETQGDQDAGRRPAQEPVQSGDDVAQNGEREGAGPLMCAEGVPGARGDSGAKGRRGVECEGLEEDLDAGIEEIEVDETLYHVYGFDVMADSDLRVWLLEVNSYPAIASGTMSAGDSCEYTACWADS